MKTKEFSRASWVRGVLLRRPLITLKQLHVEYDKGGSRPKDKRPKDMQIIYLARTELCRRWGVENVDHFPRNEAGEIVIAGMCRLYLDKFGFEKTHSHAEPYFASDGIALSSGVFSNQKTVYREKKEEAKENRELTGEPGIQIGDDDSPDANQNAGPRARKKVQIRRKPGRRKSSEADVSILFKLKECVTAAGGFDKVRKALKSLEDLQT